MINKESDLDEAYIRYLKGELAVMSLAQRIIYIKKNYSKKPQKIKIIDRRNNNRLAFNFNIFMLVLCALISLTIAFIICINLPGNLRNWYDKVTINFMTLFMISYPLIYKSSSYLFEILFKIGQVNVYDIKNEPTLTLMTIEDFKNNNKIIPDLENYSTRERELEKLNKIRYYIKKSSDPYSIWSASNISEMKISFYDI